MPTPEAPATETTTAPAATADDATTTPRPETGANPEPEQFDPERAMSTISSLRATEKELRRELAAAKTARTQLETDLNTARESTTELQSRLDSLTQEAQERTARDRLTDLARGAGAVDAGFIADALAVKYAATDDGDNAEQLIKELKASNAALFSAAPSPGPADSAAGKGAPAPRSMNDLLRGR